MSILLAWPPMDPTSILNYGLNWRKFGWLPAGINIVASSWIITPGGELENLTDTFTNDVTSIWLANGVLGRVYTCENHIVTNSTPIAQQESRRVQIKILLR